MTVVVADTSPLNHLVLIGSIDVLPELFKRVLVPDEVIREPRAIAAPPDVRTWANALPDWTDIDRAGAADNDMPHLDPGERAAILVAEVQHQALLVIDDTAGRLEATRRGIRCTGTVGVLRAAGSEGLIDLRLAPQKLRQPNFRISESLIDDLLADDARRRLE
jgi:predicted nucleic acid-binding protein